MPNVAALILQAKRFPVVHGRPEFLKRLAVFFSGIAHIFVPAIFGKLFMQQQHLPVAVVLRKNGGGGNGHIFTVSFYNTLVGHKIIGMKSIAVYQYELRLNVQLFQCEMHRVNAALQNIMPVYLGCCDFCYRKCGGMFANIGFSVKPVFLGELLGISDKRMVKTVINDYRGCYYRPAEASSAGFITARFYIMLGKTSRKISHYTTKIGNLNFRIELFFIFKSGFCCHYFNI